MVLSIAFDQFTAVSQKLQVSPYVCIHPLPLGVIVTAANPTTGVIVSTTAKLRPCEVKEKLSGEGWQVLDGQWSNDGIEQDEQTAAELTVGAVAYHSRDAKPGLWVDAFSEPQTQTQVLRAMYNEMTESGELGDVSFEEFIRLIDPNVVILSPMDLARFVNQHTPCS
jgi:hypothetical protein